MIENSFSMSDTLDNFTFRDLCSQLKNNSSGIKSNEISFDDSFYLTNSTCDFEKSSCGLSTSGRTEVLKHGNKSEKDKSIYFNNSGLLGSKQRISLKIGLTKLTDEHISYNADKENIPEIVFSKGNKKTYDINRDEEELQNKQKRDNHYDLNKYQLSEWGLPGSVLEKYIAKGVKHMFPWQFECLSNSKVLNEHCNLIYSAPTSSGKTLVAEILAFKTIFERKKKVIMILPFISIVREKMYYFQDILSTSGVRVEGFMGSYNPPGGFSSIDFAVCTIEKANSLINRLLEDGSLSEIGSVVVDEIHLLCDPYRGYILEVLLTKLRYISLRDDTVEIQIIGMSATLPNLDEVAKWLGAELYSTCFRPIPLYEQAGVCGELYDKNLQLVRKLEPNCEIGIDTDNILQLCLETIGESCSVLIFCPTKNWCENLALQLSLAFFKIGNSHTSLGELLRSEIKMDLILEILEQLKFCPAGLDQVLKKTVSFGIGFHHAGLTMDERDIIEGAFRNGAVKVLVATSTLSSGVNLPARRVLIRTPNFHGKSLDILSYRQMIGRAGRMGKDSKGESILICQKQDFKIAKILMTGELPVVESSLEGTGKLKRALLEVIASGVVVSPEDVTTFTSCTLLAITNCKKTNIQDIIDEAIEYLEKHEFIKLRKVDEHNEKYIATSLGKACLSSSIAPDEGLTLFTELEKARQCFVLETELHLIYLVTPYSACNSWGKIDWMFYLDLWDKLPAAMKRVGELVGVSEYYIMNCTRGNIESNSSKAYHKMMIHKRFFIALALQDLVNEVPLNDVCDKFSCNRGMLQSLQQSASTFAGMVTSFSKQLGWSSVEILLAQFQDRLQFGVSRDLLDLMRLPALNGKLARILYNGGVETIIQLANSDLDSVENILSRATPFESSKVNQDGGKNLPQKDNLRAVWIIGKEGLTEREAAELLISDARNYLKIEVGLKEAKWESQYSSDQITQTKVRREKRISTSKILPSGTDNQELNCMQNRISDNFFKSISTNLEKPSCTDNNVSISSKSLCNLANKSININEPLNTTDIDVDVNEVRSQIENLGLQVKNKYLSGEKLNNQVLDFDISDATKKMLINSELDESATDDIFVLQLSDDSLKSNNEDSSIEIVCSTEKQGISETFSQNVNIIWDRKKSKKRNVTLSKNCTFSIPSKITKADISTSSSEDSLLLATPTKKSRVFNEVKNSCSSTVKKLYKNNIEDVIPEIKEFSRFHIVDVCNTDLLIDTFFNELKYKQNIAFCIACSTNSEYKRMIGKNIFANEESLKTQFLKQMSYKDKKVNGFAFCWGGTESYFLSTEDFHAHEKIMRNLKTIFTDEQRSIIMFDAKQQVKLLKQSCDIEFNCKLQDPKVADWLLDPEGKEKNLQTMVSFYYKELTDIARLCGNITAVSSFGMNLNTTIDPKLRGSVEVVLIWHLIDVMKKALSTQIPKVNKITFTSFPTSYELEMRIQLCLAHIELCGMSANKTSLENLADLLNTQKNAIEKKVYSLAGRRFNLSSSSEISKVIGTFKGKKVSIKKEILQQSEHPISDLILLWRKINFIRRMVYPLIRCCESNRIYSSYVSHTATGRITMCDPNIQMLTKDFVIVDPILKKDVLISCRNAFSVPEEYTLISADYCQLELRILTYLSKDKLLVNIMEHSGDIFKCIAAKWNKVTEEMVDDNMRQHVKQLCYGIIYGMGAKTLAEKLGISKEDATHFLESFQDTYLGIKEFTKASVDFARVNGYVETITGRRRYLPQINHSDSSIKSQAERQAVNTIVQGSAADIVKNAMVTIEEKMDIVFKKTRCKPKLTLHLHDELIYEVPEKYTEKSIKVITKGMENSASMFGHFPIKVKTGKSWGQLCEYYL